jgi:hypothetical protein
MLKSDLIFFKTHVNTISGENKRFKKYEIVVNLSFSDCTNFGAIMNKFSVQKKSNVKPIFFPREKVSVFNRALMGKMFFLKQYFHDILAFKIPPPPWVHSIAK